MKKIIYFLLFLTCLTACKEEENTFQPAIGSEAFSFKPTSGGAIMHYRLPADKDIMGLNIRYKDFQGKGILRSASALCDSMELVGFNKAEENIPAEVRLVKRNGEESTPIAVTFSTNDSAPYAFFDNLRVTSGWNGFAVLTDNPSNATGMAHVFYLGKNPLTGEADTILVSSFNITSGKDTLNFSLQQKSDVNTIIVRTEDYRGYMVREESYPNIASYNTQKLNPEKFDFFFDKTIENADERLGKEYLFDGDTKGITYFDDERNNKHYNMFLAGPEAMGIPMYIDMHDNKLTAEVRMYAMINISRGIGISGNYNRLFQGLYYADKLPCKVEVYAAKDDHGTAGNWDSKQWEKVSSYTQDPDVDCSARWCANCFGDFISNSFYGYSKKTDVESADSIYLPLNLLCEGQGEGYRYLKIVVNDVYNLSEEETGYGFGRKVFNAAKYFALQELEIYTKKED